MKTVTLKKTNSFYNSLIDSKKAFKKHWMLYLFILLPLVYILIFAYGPMVGLQIAFKKFSPVLGIWGSRWTGFNNIEKFIGSYQFLSIVKNTFVISVYSLIARFPAPIILAMCINVLRNEKFKKVTQMVVYIPHFISVVVLVGMVTQLFNPYVGLYGNIYKAIFNQVANDIMVDPKVFLHMYVWSGVWQDMGWDSIIYLAALSSVSPELHEAAQIDGASRFKRILHVDFPCLIPTIITILILNVGQIMNLGFEKIYLMQNSVNIRLSEVISTYGYKIGFASGSSDYSYATAIGLFNSVINFILILTVNKIAKCFSETHLW